MSESGQGFSARTVQELTGLTHRQLVHWDRTGLVRPSVRRASGSGSRRVYSFQDLVELQVVARLRKPFGVSLQAIGRAVRYLRERHAEVRPLASLWLLTDGVRGFRLTERPNILEEVTAGGQLTAAFVVDVGGIARALQEDVAQLTAPREFTVRVRGRAYRAIARRDLEVGGYTIEFPELRGVFSEAENLSDARSMAREAIEASLGAGVPAIAAERQRRSRRG